MASQHYYSSSHDRSEYGAHQAAPLSTSKEPYGTPYGGNYVPQGPAPRKGQRLNPMTWSKRVKLIVGTLIAVILIVVIIVGAVVGTQNSKYPDYSSLTYNHADTCKFNYNVDSFLILMSHQSNQQLSSTTFNIGSIPTQRKDSYIMTAKNGLQTPPITQPTLRLMPPTSRSTGRSPMLSPVDIAQECRVQNNIMMVYFYSTLDIRRTVVLSGLPFGLLTLTIGLQMVKLISLRR